MDKLMKPFNTMEAYGRLMQSGMPEAEAKAVIDVFEGASQINEDHVATKADLAATTAGLTAEMTAIKTDVASLRSEMKAELSIVKADIHWLQRLFFGSTFLILVNIAISLVHH